MFEAIVRHCCVFGNCGKRLQDLIFMQCNYGVLWRDLYLCNVSTKGSRYTFREMAYISHMAAPRTVDKKRETFNCKLCLVLGTCLEIQSTFPRSLGIEVTVQMEML